MSELAQGLVFIVLFFILLAALIGMLESTTLDYAALPQPPADLTEPVLTLLQLA